LLLPDKDDVVRKKMMAGLTPRIDRKHRERAAQICASPEELVHRNVWENGGSEMANKRARPEEIVSKLRQVEVLVGQGMPRADAIRQIGVTEQTYYRWRKKYGGMGAEQLKELKKLQKENERLRRAVSDLTLDKLILTEAARGNF
jgi:transposase-like protein